MARTFLAGEAAVRLIPNAKSFHVETRRELANQRVSFGVTLEPDMRGFTRKAREQLKTVKLSVDVAPVLDMTAFRREAQARLDAGRDLTVKVKVDIDKTSMGQAINGLKRDLAAANFVALVKVEIDENGYRAKLDALTRPTSQKVKVEFDRDQLDQIIATLSDIGTQGVRSGAAVGGGFGRMTAAASGFMTVAQLVGNLLLGLAVISLVPLIGQLAQAAGIIALMPAGIAAVGATLATLGLGLYGISKAFTAKPGTANLANQMTQVASAQNRIAAAERNVARSQESSRRAQDKLNDERRLAVRRLRDMNDALDDAVINEEDAAISVLRAQESLGEAMATGSWLDVREARNNLRKAREEQDQLLKRNQDLRADTAAANKAGVEGDEGVVAAKQAVVDAQDAQISATENLTEASEALTKAYTTQAGGVDELAEAMAKLSPNQQEFVRDVKDLKDEFDKLRFVIGDNMFESMGEDITLLSTAYFPVLETGLGNIATTLNRGIRDALARLRDERSVMDWTTILSNTNDALGPLLTGINDIFFGFQNIAAIGSEFLPGLAGSFAEDMKSFREWTESPEGENWIRSFIEESIESVKRILKLFESIGRVIGGLFSTSETTGKSMIENMTDWFNSFADWMRTPEGQKKMQDFWAMVQQTVGDILKLIGDTIRLAEMLGLGKPQQESGGALGGAWSKEGPFNLEEGPGQIAEEIEIWKNLDWEGVSGYRWMQETFKPFITQTVPGWFHSAEDAVGGFFVDTIPGWFGGAKEATAEGVWDIGGVLDRFATETLPRWGGSIGGFFSDTVGSWWQTAQDKTADGIWALGGVLDRFFTETLPRWGENVGQFFTETIPRWWEIALDKTADGVWAVGEAMKNGFLAPINWIIDNVINGLLKNAWNTIADVIPGLPQWDSNVPRIGDNSTFGMNDANAGQGRSTGGSAGGRADGGIMPGYTPGRDIYTIDVSGGEAIMRPEWTAAVGPDRINRWNRDAKAGRLGFLAGGIAPYHDPMGKEVTPIQQNNWNVVKELFPGAELTSGTRHSGSDWHTAGVALDLGGPMLDIARYIYRNWPWVDELIHAPLDGFENIKDGRPLAYDADTMADHYDHVHMASQRALTLDGSPNPALSGLSASGTASTAVSGSATASRQSLARRAAASAFQASANQLLGTIPDFGPSLVGQIPKAFATGVVQGLTDYIAGHVASGATGVPGSPGYDYTPQTGDIVEQVKKAFAPYGWDSGPQWEATDWIVQKESGWNPKAVNPQSGAAGLGQFLGSTKDQYLPMGIDAEPYVQGQAMAKYIQDRYGDPLAAKAFWEQNNWYDNGGKWPSGTPGMNMSGQTEAVFTYPEWRMIEDLVRALSNPAPADPNKPIPVDIQSLNGQPLPTVPDTGTAYGQPLQGATIGPNGEYIPAPGIGQTGVGTATAPTTSLYDESLSQMPEWQIGKSFATSLASPFGFGNQAAKIAEKAEVGSELAGAIGKAAPAWAAAAAGNPAAMLGNVTTASAAWATKAAGDFAAYIPEASGGMLESLLSGLGAPLIGTVNTGMSQAQLVETMEDVQNRQARRSKTGRSRRR